MRSGHIDQRFREKKERKVLELRVGAFSDALRVER
jgi:hypothetical protein